MDLRIGVGVRVNCGESDIAIDGPDIDRLNCEVRQHRSTSRVDSSIGGLLAVLDADDE